MLTNNFHGFKITESPTLVIRYQYRFPKSKRRRIRKKWRKNLDNWRTKVDPQYYFQNNQIICHPEMADKLRKGYESSRHS